ncbi:MAG: orotate phosphoribosyltransferase [Deltaproteobacteria bacterium]|nr:MAG: orotate phosphoribosyltransferase [Deltaproteobacteria bacterium]
MQPYQRAFIDLLAEHDVVLFGNFTLKSGRTSPYFVNAGRFRTGRALTALGEAYAETIRHHGVPCDVVFGPAYKGVPLAVSTAMALARGADDVGYAFDRKEVKDHGEGGRFVGTQPTDGQRVVVVDDVITSGRSIREACSMLRAAAAVEVTAVVVAVDRCERGTSSRSTRAELQDELGAPVLPIVTIHEIVEHLHGRTVGGRVVLDDDRRAAMERYLAAHAAPEG